MTEGRPGQLWEQVDHHGHRLWLCMLVSFLTVPPKDGAWSAYVLDSDDGARPSGPYLSTYFVHDVQLACGHSYGNRWRLVADVV